MRGDWKLTPINQEKNSVVYSFFSKLILLPSSPLLESIYYPHFLKRRYPDFLRVSNLTTVISRRNFEVITKKNCCQIFYICIKLGQNKRSS